MPSTPRDPAHDFDALFADDDDPWKFRSRWYESRKRALTLAALPAPRYARAYEPGCANGELTAALAERCDHLLASDVAPRAVAIARGRTAALAQVEVIRADTPHEWPEGAFDLVVVSEMAYYLEPAALHRLIDRLRAGTGSHGTVLACHWRPRIEGCGFDGDTVHAQLHARLGLPHLLNIVDADLRLDVWCADPRSVAAHEGLRPVEAGDS